MVKVKNCIWAWAPGRFKKAYGFYNMNYTTRFFLILINHTWLFSKSNMHFFFIFPCYPASVEKNNSISSSLAYKDCFPKINKGWGKSILKIIFHPWSLHPISKITCIFLTCIVSEFILNYKHCTFTNKSIISGFTGDITTGNSCMFAQMIETTVFVHGKCICLKIHMLL